MPRTNTGRPLEKKHVSRLSHGEDGRPVERLICSEKGEEMSSLRPLMGSILLLVTSIGAIRSEEKRVVVPGQPPLTQDMVDDYAKFLSWRLGPEALAKTGRPERLAQLIVNDWKDGDNKRRQALLASLKWWREDFPKLSKEERMRLAAANTVALQDIERLRQSANAKAIHMRLLQQAFDARQLQILALSNIQAAAHETNMRIIDNIRPTVRYEYNPATGRYDRYVPYR